MLTRDTFDETFQPRESPSGEPLWTHAETLSQPRRYVWTVVTGDDNRSEYASPGYHIVNAVGYVVTTQPWVDDTLDAVWYDASEDEDEADEADNLIARVSAEMASDIGENFDKQSALLLAHYDEADDAGRELVDNIFICLCGWSLKTLRANTHKTSA